MIGFAVRKTMGPSVDPEAEKRKLVALAKRSLGSLKIDEAEDGFVLARRYGNRALEAKFAKAVIELRKQRIAI